MKKNKCCVLTLRRRGGGGGGWRRDGCTVGGRGRGGGESDRPAVAMRVFVSSEVRSRLQLTLVEEREELGDLLQGGGRGGRGGSDPKSQNNRSNLLYIILVMLCAVRDILKDGCLCF